MMQTKYKETEIGKIPKNWQEKDLNSLGKIVTGKTPPTASEDNFGDEYPFITPRDMKDQKHVKTTERYLSEKGKNVVKSCLVAGGTICVSCIGSDMGKVVMTTQPSVTNQQLNSIVPKNINPDFVYYAVEGITDQMRNAAFHSTAVPILNKSSFAKFKILVPNNRKETNKIAKILSDLDFKIELNIEMNKILEAIGQALFKHWFVNFEFPNEKSKPYKENNGEMVESELGKIPKRWGKGCLADILKISINGDWGNDSEFEGAVKAISLRGTDLGSLKSCGNAADAPIRWIKRSRLEKRIINSCNILIGGSGLGPIGKTVYCSESLNGLYEYPVTYSNFCKCLIAEVPAYAIYAENILENMYLKGEMNQFYTGTSIPNLDVKSLMEYPIVIPSKDIILKFYDIAKQRFQVLFDKENILLSHVRDALLPHLMSGKIKVNCDE